MIWFLIGILTGVIFATIGFYLLVAGDLRVDKSDPDEEPYLFLELPKDLKFIRKKKYVILRVNLKNFISHK